MKTITVHVIDKNSSRQMSETFTVKNKKDLQEAKEQLFKEVTYSKWFYQVESFEDFTNKEKEMLDELELTPDM